MAKPIEQQSKKQIEEAQEALKKDVMAYLEAIRPIGEQFSVEVFPRIQYAENGATAQFGFRRPVKEEPKTEVVSG